MTKIFISHSTKDSDIAIKLMDLLQTQFNLQRENFYLTSDEELKAGENWIEDIRLGMEAANIVLPLISPNFLASQFCLCELGATWINKKALVPVILPPLNFNALQETPFRSGVQSIILNSEQDLIRLAQNMIDKGVGHVNFPRFTSRAITFLDEVLIPYKESMESREVISEALVSQLRRELNQFKEAFTEAEKDIRKLNIENQDLRKMKDKEEVQAYEYSKMDNWDNFNELVKKTTNELKKLPYELPSVLFQTYRYNRRVGEEHGLISPSINTELKQLSSRGFVEWEEGWVPNLVHPLIKSANLAIEELSEFLSENITEELEKRFYTEYEGIIFSMNYSDFWEKVIGVTIYVNGE